MAIFAIGIQNPTWCDCTLHLLYSCPRASLVNKGEAKPTFGARNYFHAKPKVQVQGYAGEGCQSHPSEGGKEILRPGLTSPCPQGLSEASRVEPQALSITDASGLSWNRCGG